MNDSQMIHDIVLKIAQKHFFIDSLEQQNKDSLDFKNVAIWSIVSAIKDAYSAGCSLASKGSNNKLVISEQDVEKIAKEFFDVETLEARKRDSLDFYDVSVSLIKSGLTKSFSDGYNAYVLSQKRSATPTLKM